MSKTKPPKFTVQELAEVTIYYYQSGSYKEAQLQYQAAHKLPSLDNVPPRTVIRRCKENFKMYGTVEKRTNVDIERKRTRTLENIQRVKGEIERDPKTSMRALSRKLGIKQGTIHKILVEDLKRRPYKTNRANQNERVWMPAPVKNKGALSRAKGLSSGESEKNLYSDHETETEATDTSHLPRNLDLET